jgi:hypothetical protein
LVYDKKGLVDEAIDTYEKAIELDSNPRILFTALASPIIREALIRKPSRLMKNFWESSLTMKMDILTWDSLIIKD